MSLRESINNVIPKRSAWAGLMLVIVAAVTLEATSLIQSYYARQGLREEASKRAETQLEASRNKIMDVINQTETAVTNSIWIAQWCLDYPDSLERVCKRLVVDNPVIAGSTIALVPGYSRRRPLFSPYVCHSGDTLALKSLATEEYNYPEAEWFVKPIELNRGYWSEPYVDTGGGEMLMTTYSVPIKDKKGKTAAVLTGDLALDWLSDIMGKIEIYPNANSIMLSQTGRFMVSKSRQITKNLSLAEVVAQIKDHPDYKELERAMYAGESGVQVISFDGSKSYVYYAPIERTGWSMCIIIPSEDIFGDIQKLDRWVQLLQLLGLLMLILIIHFFVRSLVKNRELKDRKDRMENELHIARGIQMAMIPKTFPPFPERHDLDMAATIIPAKEVGGDLYDFFIRDEKLFFSIGDVSGKGVPASLVMAVTRSIFRSIAGHENSPKTIVSGLNDALAEMNENSMFVTFFCGVLDMDTGVLKYCNAGHNPPMILTNEITELKVEPNLPLGILPGMEYKEQQCKMHHDDALFLYTDGLSEAENSTHQQFGLDRIKEALRGFKNSDAHLSNIQNTVNAFVGDAPQSDDLTMLFIHYLGEARRKACRGVYNITLDNNVSQISRLAGFIEEIAGENSLDSGLAMSLNLALEEAVTNVVLYAYPQGTAGTVDVSAKAHGGKLTFTLSDSGTPFDPTQVPDADTNAPLEERRIGGLGIHLVRNIMDSVKYEYSEGKNILTMIKNI